MVTVVTVGYSVWHIGRQAVILEDEVAVIIVIIAVTLGDAVAVATTEDMPKM